MAQIGGYVPLPAHADRTPLLSVTFGRHAILLHCIAGCANRAVIAALAHSGVRPREFFDGGGRPPPREASANGDARMREKLRIIHDLVADRSRGSGMNPYSSGNLPREPEILSTSIGQLLRTLTAGGAGAPAPRPSQHSVGQRSKRSTGEIAFSAEGETIHDQRRRSKGQRRERGVNATSALPAGEEINDSHRLREILERYRAASEEQDRAEAEARRVAEEDVRRKARLQKAWTVLQPRRKQVLEEINAALRDTGFQLQVFGETISNEVGELESFKVKFTGRQHPQLDHVFLRISLRENGNVFVDVTGAKELQRMRSLALDEFTIVAWRDILLDHLAIVAPREETREAAGDMTNPTD